MLKYRTELLPYWENLQYLQCIVLWLVHNSQYKKVKRVQFFKIEYINIKYSQ